MRTVTYLINGTIETTSYDEMKSYMVAHPNAKVKTNLADRSIYADDEVSDKIKEIERKRIAINSRKAV